MSDHELREEYVFNISGVCPVCILELKAAFMRLETGKRVALGIYRAEDNRFFHVRIIK